MAYLNNVYGNAAYLGAVRAQIDGRKITSAVAVDYLNIKTQALLAATAIDALIAFDALVTTAAAITWLDGTTITIQANHHYRQALLEAITYSCMSGRDWSHAVAGDYTAVAAAVFAAWTEMLLGLVTP